MPVYLDTSALLKLYILELGSHWVDTVVRPRGIIVSALAITEVGATLTRRTREGLLSERDARDAWRTFRRELRGFDVVQLGQAVLQRAADITARVPVPLRALDAIHLQCAAEASGVFRIRALPALELVSADQRLLQAAQSLGFATDNPDLHP